jgi:phosphatidylglycerophosphatase A
MAITAKAILTNPTHCLAFGFGSGLFPKAPGTAGTVVAIPFYIALAHLSPWLYGLALLLTFAVGVYLCGKTASDLGVHDHPGIVWDEFVGYWVAMALAPASWLWIAVGFVLFRLFDIWKPWPIRNLDRNVHGGLGIMLDDVVAGCYALIVLQLLLFWFG